MTTASDRKSMPLPRDDRYRLFKNVYENNLWGRSKSGGKYNSDSPPELTRPYREYVSEFILTHNVRNVIDLGCGDFEASGGIDMGQALYVGVDLYDSLIDHNTRLFGNDRRRFLARDLVEDKLPPGDLALITMVLGILSFEEVFRILDKLDTYRYILITDGQPDILIHERRNIDKPTDKYTRRDYYNNGFYLELPPFKLDIRVVCQYQVPSGELIRTVLLDNKKPPSARS